MTDGIWDKKKPKNPIHVEKEANHATEGTAESTPTTNLKRTTERNQAENPGMHLVNGKNGNRDGGIKDSTREERQFPG